MAVAAGLTRMHFAAQFRAATGMRPHGFLLQRRIERAQELLRDPELALVDVALSVGSDAGAFHHGLQALYRSNAESLASAGFRPPCRETCHRA